MIVKCWSFHFKILIGFFYEMFFFHEIKNITVYLSFIKLLTACPHDCVFPKPGSAVCFPSDILHCAEDVSREFYGIRVSAAYKLKKVENKDAEPSDI